eukprot:496525_1
MLERNLIVSSTKARDECSSDSDSKLIKTNTECSCCLSHGVRALSYYNYHYILIVVFVLMSLAFLSLSHAYIQDGRGDRGFYIKIKQCDDFITQTLNYSHANSAVSHLLRYSLPTTITYHYESAMVDGIGSIRIDYDTLTRDLLDRGYDELWDAMEDRITDLRHDAPRHASPKTIAVVLGLYGQVINYGTLVSIISLGIGIISVLCRFAWPLCFDSIFLSIRKCFGWFTGFGATCAFCIKFLTVACTLLIFCSYGSWEEGRHNAFYICEYEFGIYFWLDIVVVVICMLVWLLKHRPIQFIV